MLTVIFFSKHFFYHWKLLGIVFEWFAPSLATIPVLQHLCAKKDPKRAIQRILIHYLSLPIKTTEKFLKSMPASFRAVQV